MKPWLKKIIIALGLTATLLIIVIGVLGYRLMSKLPSPSQIAKNFNSNTASEKGKVLPGADVSESKQVSAVPQASTVEELKKIAEVEEQRRMNKIAEVSIFDYQRPLVDVCKYLDDARDSDLLKSDKDFFIQVGEALEKNPNDPFSESVIATLRYVTRLPRAKDLFLTIQNVKGDSDRESTIAEKALFYAKAVLAYQEMQSMKKQINDFSNRSYHLFVLSQAARENPEIAKAPQLSDYCEKIQNALNNDVPYDAVTEGQEMQKFLQWAKVDADKIKFEPSLKSEVFFEFDKNQFKMGFGWPGKFMQPTGNPNGSENGGSGGASHKNNENEQAG